VVIAWWREQGGAAISFASDAHAPGLLARGFPEAVSVATAAGFRGGRHPYDFWVRD
jgi:histidinol-phosphatase (PHP family)